MHYKKLYIIAGEPSGDLHGGNLVRALKQKQADLEIYAWGGEVMEEAGAVVRKHYRDLAFMGFLEVVKNIRTIQKNFTFCKKDIEAFKPDAVILIDYPGFNLRMAKWLKQRGYKVIYYISPQVWAWKEGRVKDIKKYVDEMLVILPFEKDFYEKKWQYAVQYVGHPLLDAIARNTYPELSVQTDKKIIALLPGSRKQEIEKKLPIFLQMVSHFPNYQFVIAGVPHLGDAFYKKMVGDKNIPVVYNETYSLLKSAYAALVTSGTATLETALHKVPQVVCYKGNWFSYQIGKRLINVPFISLVNLIYGKKIVDELIQDEVSEVPLKAALENILEEKNRTVILHQYDELEKLLGLGNASKTAAEAVLKNTSLSN